MNKIHLTIALVLVGLIFSIFFVSQKESFVSTFGPTPLPTLPAGEMAFITPQTNQPPPPQEQTAQQQTQIIAPTIVPDTPLSSTISAKLDTSKGTIELQLFGDKAPNTVRNFIQKAKSGFYTNLSFHRVENWVIQGGDPLGDGTGGGKMISEFSPEPFVIGSLGVARASDPAISNDAQFFITKTAASHLNNQYTNFGIVISGMDVVNAITVGDKIKNIIIE